MFTNGNKQFYSCSACRDHKICNFYAAANNENVNEKSNFTPEKIAQWHQIYLESQPSYEEHEKKLF